MRVGAMRVELFLPGAHSLKEKRRPLKSLIGRLEQRFRVVASEVDHQDLHQRAALGLAFVAADGPHLLAQMQAVRTFVESNPEFQVLAVVEALFDGPAAPGS